MPGWLRTGWGFISRILQNQLYAYLLVVIVFTLVIYQQRQFNERMCIARNDQTRVLRDFMQPLIKEPEASQFAFIQDKTTREGAFERARMQSAQLRASVSATFVDQDCS